MMGTMQIRRAVGHRGAGGITASVGSIGVGGLIGAVLVMAVLVTPNPHLTVGHHRAMPDYAATTTSEPVSGAPIVDVATDAATGGYWLVASNGAVFNVDAPALGSAGTLPLTSPVVGMTATPDDGGYWLTAADGGVFAYGDARFAGSMGAAHLTRPVVGMAATPNGTGYWLVAGDGGIFSFGAPYEGSTGVLVLDRAVVAMAVTPDGGGYWLVGADGGVYALGDALYQGSVSVLPLAGLTVVIDPGHDGGNGADPSFIDRPIDGGGFTETLTPPAPRPTTAIPSTPSTTTWRCGPRPFSRPTGRASCSHAPPTAGSAPVSTSAPRSPTPSTPMRPCRSTPTAARPAGAGSPSTPPCRW